MRTIVFSVLGFEITQNDPLWCYKLGWENKTEKKQGAWETRKKKPVMTQHCPGPICRYSVYSGKHTSEMKCFTEQMK